MIIDGKSIAEKIISDLQKLPKPDKMLAAVLVGNNAQSLSFLRQKEKMAQALDIPFHLYQFDESISEEDLIAEIKKIGADGQIGGIIVQLPLPAHYNRDAVLAAINPKKDIDAMTLESGKYVSPLPVAVIQDLLLTLDIQLLTLSVAVVGRGFLVGKPIIEWLNGKCRKFEVFHSKSDLADLKNADLVITGVGKAGLIKPEMLKNGAGVIDFGYSIGKSQMANGKLRIFGDLDTERSALGDSRLAFYTPTPGGTGPILVAEIFKNFYKLAGC